MEKLTPFDEILRLMYKNWQIYVDMNCQQICKISPYTYIYIQLVYSIISHGLDNNLNVVQQ